jgi:hypothetical protein
MSSSGGDEERIGASWTRGLILHPICKSIPSLIKPQFLTNDVAAAIIFIALLLSLSQHLTVTLYVKLHSSHLSPFLN